MLQFFEVFFLSHGVNVVRGKQKFPPEAIFAFLFIEFVSPPESFRQTDESVRDSKLRALLAWDSFVFKFDISCMEGVGIKSPRLLSGLVTTYWSAETILFRFYSSGKPGERSPIRHLGTRCLGVYRLPWQKIPSFPPRGIGGEPPIRGGDPIVHGVPRKFRGYATL